MLVLMFGVIGVTLLLFHYFIIKPYNYWKDRGVKQGKPLRIVWDNWKILFGKENLIEMSQRIYKQSSGERYLGMYQFFGPTLVLKDPDLIKQIAVKDFDHFTDHNCLIPEEVDPLWGKNLFSLKGHKWRDMRTILSPSFTSSKMKTMFVLITECAENFVQHFQKKNGGIVTIEFKDAFTRFANDVIATSAFGIKVDSLEQPQNRFYLMGKETTNFSGFWKTLKILGYFICPKIYSFMKIQLFSKEVNIFFQKIVMDMIHLREEKNIVRPDMINLLIEARRKNPKLDGEENGTFDTEFSIAQKSDLLKAAKPHREITDMDITAQAMIFFFAGFDSVSGLMSFLAYELATNPDVQHRLRDEIRLTVEECEGNLTYEGLLKMKYLDMVVSEALRKWPIIVGIDRVCTKPYTIQPTKPDEKPLHLKKGDMVWFPMYGMHHDPKYFPDPERFDPKRFSDESKDRINPYTYFPFGLGPRNCIGSRFALLETKIVFFHILKNFELVPVEKSVIPIQITKKQLSLTAEGGFWLGLKYINV